MDSSISVRVFDWKGDIWLAVDRIGSADHRKHAHRDRLATFRETPVHDVSEDVALLWMLEQLQLWVNAGAPFAWSEAPSAPPGGGRRGRPEAWACPRREGEDPLRSETQPPPLEDRASEASSDGLWPPGYQPELW